MPKYAYQCRECDNHFEIVHSIKEKLADCEHCGMEGTLKRIPFVPHIFQKHNQPGKLVVQHIEDVKQELKQEKEELSKVEYE